MVTFTFVKVMAPPYVTSTPCEASPVVTMLPLLMVMAELVPVAKRPLAPAAAVFTVPPVMPSEAAEVINTPAFVPYWLLVSFEEESPVLVIVGFVSVSLPLVVTFTADSSAVVE